MAVYAFTETSPPKQKGQSPAEQSADHSSKANIGSRDPEAQSSVRQAKEGNTGSDGMFHRYSLLQVVQHHANAAVVNKQDTQLPLALHHLFGGKIDGHCHLLKRTSLQQKQLIYFFYILEPHAPCKPGIMYM